MERIGAPGKDSGVRHAARHDSRAVRGDIDRTMHVNDRDSCAIVARYKERGIRLWGCREASASHPLMAV